MVQRTSLVVEVKPVHYMMINVKKVRFDVVNTLFPFNFIPDTFFSPQAFLPLPGSSLSQLPRGLSLPMWVSYHDNTGGRFDAVSLPTDYRPSRYVSSRVLTLERLFFQIFFVGSTPWF